MNKLKITKLTKVICDYKRNIKISIILDFKGLQNISKITKRFMRLEKDYKVYRISKRLQRNYSMCVETTITARLHKRLQGLQKRLHEITK